MRSPTNRTLDQPRCDGFDRGWGSPASGPCCPWVAGQGSRRRAARPATSARGGDWGAGPRAAGPARGCSARALTPGRTVRERQGRGLGRRGTRELSRRAAHMNGDRIHTLESRAFSGFFFGVLAGCKMCRWVPRRFRCRGWRRAWDTHVRSAAVWIHARV
jgi:hypothetical protein